MSVMMSILSSELSFCNIFMLKYGNFFVWFFLFIFFTGVKKDWWSCLLKIWKLKLQFRGRKFIIICRKLDFFCDYLEQKRSHAYNLGHLCLLLPRILNIKSNILSDKLNNFFKTTKKLPQKNLNNLQTDSQKPQNQ